MLRKMKNRFADQKTANKILIILLPVCILPLSLILLTACTIWTHMIISKTDALMESRMSMSRKSLDDYFTAYENIIMNVYTSNQYAADLERLNLMDTKNYYSIRRRVEKELQNIAYLNPGILGIGIASNKYMIFHDAVTRQSAESCCFPESGGAWRDLVRQTRQETQMLYAGAVCRTAENGGKKNVIYLAHRLADLNNYGKGTSGSIVLCIDETDVRRVYSQNEDMSAQLSLLCDRKGTIVSCPGENYIGLSILPEGEELTRENAAGYMQAAISEYGMMDSGRCLVYAEPVCGSRFWQISIQDEDALLKDLKYIVAIVVLIGMMTVLAACIVTFRFADIIENSMQKIIAAMDEAHGGNYQVRIENERKDEFGKISRHFNDMVRRIEESARQEKEALIREKNAEIQALEAQINPHFLYNTLDAINWTAIENEQFKISRMLKDLATILRYSIQGSNSVVTLSDEIEYLKKYILLQQQRFNFSFKCYLEIDESVLDCKIHKLLFQPLVENAIVHGFPGEKEEDTIWIQVAKEDERRLRIVVRDNGAGMAPELTEDLNRFNYRKNSAKSNIGIRNVFMRVKYYYGEQGDFSVLSNENGTKVSLWILNGRDGESEDCNRGG